MNPATKPAAALGACLLASLIAAAQTPPSDSAPAEEQPVKLETFSVTGSYIPFASTQTALPVTVLNAEAIADTGAGTDVLDVLRKAVPQFAGNGNIGSENANVNMGLTGGGSMISFRNTQTLVLVNGRRMAYAPALSSGGLQFVDVNLIPLSAVERIEVLQDGASATYGTDAIAGVVNIILKTGLDGFEVDGRYSVSPNEGHYSERKYSLAGGARSGRTSLTLSAEFANSDELPQYQRAFATPGYGTVTFAGVITVKPNNAAPQFYVLNPSLTAPPAGHTPLATLVADGVYLPVDGDNLAAGVGAEQQYAFDLSRYTKLLMQRERRSATANLEHRVSDSLTFFGDVIFVQTRTHSELNAQPISAPLEASNPSNPTTQTITVRNRLVDHPRLYDYHSTSIRAIAGARGTWENRFHWEAAVDRNLIRQDLTNGNLVDSTNRAAAVASGLLNLASRVVDPAAVAAAGIFGTAWGKARSALTTVDARITGDLGDLPAGPVGFALGAEYRVETLTEDSDPNSQNDTFNWDSAPVLNPFHESRRVWSFFGEMRVPLAGETQRIPGVHSLDLSAAARHEHYSDSGDTTMPKVSLAWRPGGSDWLLRGTYSKSFSAPTLFELFGPASVDSAQTVSFAPLGGGDDVYREFHIRTGANPDLKPSRSTNWTFGCVWSPAAVKGLSVAADWFDIVQTGLVSDVDPGVIIDDVELKGPGSYYAPFVRVGAFDGTPIAAAGQLSADTSGDIYVTGSLVNIADVRLSGADVKVEYYHGTRARGRLDASIAVSYYRSYSFQSQPGAEPVETVGQATDFNGTLPRWQSHASVEWTRGPWHANVGWQHIPGVTDPLGNGSERSPSKIASYDSFDVAAAWTLELNRKWARQVVVRIGANDVFNRMPPYGGGTFPLANADTGTYSPVGRLLFVEGKYRF